MNPVNMILILLYLTVTEKDFVLSTIENDASLTPIDGAQAVAVTPPPA
jgi:hypothetical protein